MLRLLFVSVLLSGCAGVRVAHVSERLPEKPPDCELELLSVPPSQPFREVARLRFEGVSTLEADYVRESLKQACRLGGDAVIMQFQYWPGVGGGGGAAVIKWGAQPGEPRALRKPAKK